MTNDSLQAVKDALAGVSPSDRKRIFDQLRREFPIHELEQRWNVPAEVVLEAIARAPDLTQRGLRGVIAEAAFGQSVVVPLLSAGWKDETPPGDNPFDYRLTSTAGVVTVQVKNQRSEKKTPKLWNKRPGVFVVETQKTRSGKDIEGQDTRPYRFGEFDILAVCLHPSTNDWGQFLYTVAKWLLPRDNDPALVAVLQPVNRAATADWTDDFATAVAWHRSGATKTITA